jgi:hypothetical protein
MKKSRALTVAAAAGGLLAPVAANAWVCVAADGAGYCAYGASWCYDSGGMHGGDDPDDPIGSCNPCTCVNS